MDTPQRRILPHSPPVLLVVALAATGWSGLWVLVIPPALLPVAYVVPLALGFWTGRRSALWLSAALFALMTGAKAALVPPGSTDTVAWVAAALASIAGGTAATLWLLYRSENTATLATPAPVSALPRAESSPPAREPAKAREELLQLLLRSLTHADPHGREFPAVLTRVLAVLGPAANGSALLVLAGEEAELLAATGPGAESLPSRWSVARSSLAAAVAARRALVAPFAPEDVHGPADATRAAIVAPALDAEPACVLVAWSSEAVRWSDDQVATLAWAAAQVRPWLEARARTAAVAAAPRVEGPAGAALRILLVEDHDDTGFILSRVLRTEGHEVTHARDATAALASFAARSFDLVITDLGLPDEDGATLMERLQRQRPGLPGICMTGFGQEVIADRGAAFSCHLRKPVEVGQLHAAIARAIPATGSRG